MRLNRSTILILLACLLVILGASLFREPLNGLINPPSPTPLVQNLLPENIAQIASSLRIQEDDDFVQIDKIEGAWQIVDGTYLDNSLETYHDFVVGIIALTGEFEYASTFTSEDLKQYGLDTSQKLIHLQSPDRAYNLIIGHKNPDGNRYYVRFDTSNQIYLLPAVFEIDKILQLAQNPPYLQLSPEVTAEASNSKLLFPDVFGYQIASFEIQDKRDGSWIRYSQGEQGTWSLEGTYVDTTRPVNYGNVAVNVSLFLFMEVETSSQVVRNSVTDVSILTLSMTTFEEQTYTMYVVEPIADNGYVVQIEGQSQVFIAPVNRVNRFIDMIHLPPYAS